MSMKLTSYLLFNGNCEEAFKFYEKCLGGKIIAMLPHTGTPAEQHMPAGFGNKILHARLDVGDQMIMASDCPPDRYQLPKGFSVSITVTDPAEAERIFHELEVGGKVELPIQQTFFSPRFGMLRDRFGTPWMVNCAQAAEHAS